MQNDIDVLTCLYAKPLWSNQDIMAFTNLGKTKACKIHREAAIKHKGVNKLCPQKVKRDAVLEVLGLDFNEEVSKLKSLRRLKNENNSIGN